MVVYFDCFGEAKKEYLFVSLICLRLFERATGGLQKSNAFEGNIRELKQTPPILVCDCIDRPKLEKLIYAHKS